MNIDLVNSKIKEADKILILPSQPPDIDCLTSALIIKWYILLLKSKNADVRIYSFFQIPGKLKIFPEIEEIDQKYLDKVDLSVYDLIIGVDGNAFERYLTNSFNKYLSPNDLIEKFIVFDHHQPDNNTQFKEELYFSNQEISSTTQVIYQTLLQKIEIPPIIATYIYAGIASDTGNFKWNIQPQTFKVASELLEKGADYLTATNISVPRKEIDFLVWAIQHTQYFPEIKTTLLYIDKPHYDELEGIFGNKWDFKDLDRYYKNSFCKLVEDYDYYLILKEDKKDNNVRISWRIKDLSEKDIDFIKIFQNMGYEAGGHHNSGNARAFGVKIEDVWNNLKVEIAKAFVS